MDVLCHVRLLGLLGFGRDKLIRLHIQPYLTARRAMNG